jgi:RNA polymerase sigma-70 factor
MMHRNSWKLAEFMTLDPTLASLKPFLAQYGRLARALHAEAMCARWDSTLEAFAEGLRRSAEKRFAGGGPQSDPGAVEAYLKSLHLQDLALACACTAGNEKAWEFFIAHFRQDLRVAASAMLRGSGRADDARAEELADSLHAELYGVRQGEDGRRKSLFEYFHGRSKLGTWLRAVLAQKQVDQFRTIGKNVSLDAEDHAESPRVLAGRLETLPTNPDPDRAHYVRSFDRALADALASLTPRERMILACYYADELTLAEIGRMVHEHESTISRQLERTRRALRDSVSQALQRGSPAGDGRAAEVGLDAAQIEMAFEYALEDSPLDLSKALSAPGPAGELPKP